MSRDLGRAGLIVLAHLPGRRAGDRSAGLTAALLGPVFDAARSALCPMF